MGKNILFLKKPLEIRPCEDLPWFNFFKTYLGCNPEDQIIPNCHQWIFPIHKNCFKDFKPFKIWWLITLKELPALQLYIPGWIHPWWQHQVYTIPLWITYPSVRYLKREWLKYNFDLCLMKRLSQIHQKWPSNILQNLLWFWGKNEVVFCILFHAATYIY